MRIEIRKIGFEPKKFNFRFNSSSANVFLVGNLYRLPNGLIKLDSNLYGDIELICYLSGESFIKSINDNISFLIKNGIWKPKDDYVSEDFDVLESFDGYIDLEKIVIGELESIRLDYHAKE